MTKDPTRFDQLEVLRKAAWESVVSRRSIEWKVNFALSGLLVSLIAALSSQKLQLDITTCWAKVVVFHLSALVILLHFRWLGGLARAHLLDRDEEAALRKEMCGIAGFQELPEITKQQSQISNDKRRIRRAWWTSWSHGPQFVITLVLALLACAVVLAKS